MSDEKAGNDGIDSSTSTQVNTAANTPEDTPRTVKATETARAADVSHRTALARLRVKFIALNMATAFVILAVVLTGICVAEWQRSVAEVDASLTTALESVAVQEFVDLQVPPRIGNAGTDDVLSTAVSVAVYQVGSEGQTKLISGISSASLDDETLSAALQELGIDYSTMLIAEGEGSTSADPGAEAAEQRDNGTSLPDSASPSESPTPQAPVVIQRTGTMLGLHYAVATAGTDVYVAFADEAATQGWQDLAFTLALGGLAALAVFFLISLVFSRWALRPVQAAWQRQRDFIADASHELKTPLTVVMADLDIVRGQRESTVAEQDKWLESARHESERMQNLVQDMLELARLDADERMKGSERISLSDLLEGELLEYESLFFERGVRLETEIAPEVNVEGNVQRLKRLVGTLADNACKYAGTNGHVTVKLERESGKARLSVNNTGTPIPADDLPHVFDRFYRANHARTHEEGPGGTGLGLAIAHEIAAEHKGSISVASSADAGTTFTVTLPLAK